MINFSYKKYQWEHFERIILYCKLWKLIFLLDFCLLDVSNSRLDKEWSFSIFLYISSLFSKVFNSVIGIITHPSYSFWYVYDMELEHIFLFIITLYFQWLKGDICQVVIRSVTYLGPLFFRICLAGVFKVVFLTVCSAYKFALAVHIQNLIILIYIPIFWNEETST